MERLIREIQLQVYAKILTEAKIDKVMQKWPALKDYLYHFSSLKPKYVFWAARQFVDFLQIAFRINAENPDSVATIRNEDDTRILNEIGRMQTLLQKFDDLVSAKRIKDRDITAYDSVDELSQAVLETTKELKRKQDTGAEQKKVFENKDWLLVQPLNKAASCKYGKGTKWCISGDNLTAWEEFTKEGDEFLFVFDKRNKRKYAVQLDFEGDVFIWDEKDKQVPHGELAYIIPDIEVQEVIKRFTGNPLLFIL